MINLLPAELKAEMQAGLLNTQLRRFITILILALLLTSAVFGAGLSITLRNKVMADNTKEKETSSASQYNRTKASAEAYADNLAAAKTILSGQISYTSLVIDITNTLPKGTSLASLTIDNASFGKPFTLDAKAQNYDAALKLKQALADKKITVVPGKPQVPLMTKVSLVDVRTSDNPADDYRLAVSISGILTKQPPVIDEQGAGL